MTDDMPKLPTSFGGFFVELGKFIIEIIVFFIKAAFFIAGIVLVGGFGFLGLFCTLAGLKEHNSEIFILIGLALLAIAYVIGYIFTKAFKK